MGEEKERNPTTQSEKGVWGGQQHAQSLRLQAAGAPLLQWSFRKAEVAGSRSGDWKLGRHRPQEAWKATKDQ